MKFFKNINKLKAKINPFIALLLKYYPFTFFGSLLFIVAITLFWTWLIEYNPLSLLIAIISLFILIVFTILNRVQLVLYNKCVCEWDSSPPLYARQQGVNHWLLIRGITTFPFFQLHFCLKGRLQVGRKAFIQVKEETSSAVSTINSFKIALPLYFPLCGTFQARGQFILKDIFGLTRAPLNTPERRVLSIRPALLEVKEAPEVIAVQGFEDSQKKSTAEIEKYFMREYIPGDRLRDINWKATSRLSKLITKISPQTQQKSQTITVFFRNFKEKGGESLESIMHLNHIKSRLVSFLNSVKMENTDFTFKVFTAESVFNLDNQEDINNFFIDLCHTFYERDTNVINFERSTNEIFIFTTQYDKHINSFLSIFSGAKIYLAYTRKANASQQDNTQTYHVFKPFRASLIPGPWIFSKEKSKPHTHPRKAGEIIIKQDILDVKLI